MEWSYGVTTVPERLHDLLPKTLSSLKLAGFPEPRLFVDGLSPGDWELSTGALGQYDVTLRNPKLRSYGNWMLAAWELFVRKPHADRYAIFQDDFVTYRNLRQYLERCEYPECGYWNLYTFKQNEKPIKGWYESNQLGKGAVALVFSQEAIRLLLAQQYMVDRPLNPNRGWKAIDGGIVSAYKKIGWKEYVHNPSLVQHTGIESSMGNRRHEQASTFLGEEFDALKLLDENVELNLNDPRNYRIGLMGHNCEGWLGDRNWELAANTDITSWLVKPNGAAVTRSPLARVDTVLCPTPNELLFQRFLNGIDVLVFCEKPVYPQLVTQAKQQGIRTVCVIRTDEVESWMQDVDLFLCTSSNAYNTLRADYCCVEFSWPNKWRTGADKEFNLVVRTGEHRIAIV